MAVKKESTLQTKIQRRLKQLGVYCYKTHGGPMQRAGMPDLCCIIGGIACYIEVKRPGEQPTKLQWHRMAELREAGAMCFVAYDVDDLIPIEELMRMHDTILGTVKAFKSCAGML